MLPGEIMTYYQMMCQERVRSMDELSDLSEVFILESSGKIAPIFRDLSEDTYRQLESGIYSIWGRKKNISVKKYHEDGSYTYKNWGLQEITIPQSHFEYLNAPWLYLDLRPNKVFDYWCKEAYIFDKLVIVIQEVHYDNIMCKILVKDEDEELKLYIEDVLEFKPHMIVPDREIQEINELEAHGVHFNSTPEEVDKNGIIISNLDHYDNYLYEIYDTKRNSYKHLNREKERRCAEAQCIWLESWIDQKELNNDIITLLSFMDDTVIKVFNQYTYQNESFFDRRSCGGHLFEDVEYEVFNPDTMEEETVKGKRMERICKDLDISVSAGWDIWKFLNMEKMQEVVDELYREFPI